MMRRVSAWFRAHPLTTFCLALVGFAVGTHLFANWRAEVRWQHYCAEARARGVKLTLAEWTPPEIPDAENFAALPMFREIFNGGVQRPMELPNKSHWHPSTGNTAKGERFDWQVWQKFFKDNGLLAETTDEAPRDVLRALEHYAPQFKEWSEWRTRPHVRFPLDSQAAITMDLPHIWTLRDAARLFELRMRAHLALGEPSAAYADFLDGFQAFHALENEPTMIAATVQTSMLNALCESVGDGLMDRAWTGMELAKIGDDLASVAFWKRYRLALESERGLYNLQYDGFAAASRAERWNLYAASLNGRPGPPIMSYINYVPRRFFRDNQLRHNQWTDELLAGFSKDATRFDPDAPAPSGPRNWSNRIDLAYYFLFRVNALPEQTSRFVTMQTKLDQTRLAVALERFRQARGAFPERLAELVPDFIAEVPVDVYSRQPMIYRRKEGGTFLLYGVGSNRRDEGGADESEGFGGERRDIVWRYAPPAQ